MHSHCATDLLTARRRSLNLALSTAFCRIYKIVSKALHVHGVHQSLLSFCHTCPARSVNMKLFLLFSSAFALVHGRCDSDNCARAVTGTIRGLAAQSSVKKDCESFFRTTISPATVSPINASKDIAHSIQVTATATSSIYPFQTTITRTVGTNTVTVTSMYGWSSIAYVLIRCSISIYWYGIYYYFDRVRNHHGRNCNKYHTNRNGKTKSFGGRQA